MNDPSLTGMDALPDELFVHIIYFLDTTPPSELKARHEPNLELTGNKTGRPLKDLSRVSRRWRDILLPVLFTHTRLRLDAPAQPHWQNCPARCHDVVWNQTRWGWKYCPVETVPRPSFPKQDLDAYHFDMLHSYHTPPVLPLRQPKSSETTKYKNSIPWWAPHFYHGLVDFLDFLSRNDLKDGVQSFILLTGPMLLTVPGRFPHEVASSFDIRYRAAAAFWQHLLNILNPPRIGILARPIDLACLTNATIDAEDGEWAFGDMEYQFLTLGQNSTATYLSSPVDANNLLYIPDEHPSIAPASLINLRPWAHVGVNEGSFLKAYGTYEYFERGPPSLIYSINNVLAASNSRHHTSSLHGGGLRNLRSFAYTAIFPFASHLLASTNALLDRPIERLDVQLAPDISSTILDEPARVGKAELMDCWAELLGSYHGICGRLLVSGGSGGGANDDDDDDDDNENDDNDDDDDDMLGSNITERAEDPQAGLKVLVCRDVCNAMLREDLNIVFRPLNGMWEEKDTGVFEKIPPPTNDEDTTQSNENHENNV